MKHTLLATLFVVANMASAAEYVRLFACSGAADGEYSVFFSKDAGRTKVVYAGTKVSSVIEIEEGPTFSYYDFASDLGITRLIYSADGRHELQAINEQGNWGKVADLTCK